MTAPPRTPAAAGVRGAPSSGRLAADPSLTAVDPTATAETP
ncbi:hypothetical protein AB0D04_35750 [Streptomyces sp. NPDC048483]